MWFADKVQRTVYVSVCVKMPTGRCTYIRINWDQSCDVYHPALLSAEAPARLERCDSNSFMNHIFPTVQSQHVVNLVSHHNLWSRRSVVPTPDLLEEEKKQQPGSAFYKRSDDGGQ